MVTLFEADFDGLQALATRVKGSSTTDEVTTRGLPTKRQWKARKITAKCYSVKTPLDRHTEG